MARVSAVRQRSLRELNLAAVLGVIYDDVAAPSRAAVAARTGLTKATVSTLVDQLIAARFVRELPLPEPRRAGRPGVPLAPQPRSLVGLGLEVNVGYYGARALDLTGTVVAERVVEADLVGSDPADVLGDLRSLTSELIAQLDADGMVPLGARLALPGLVRAEAGVLEVAPNIGWRSVRAADLLALEGLDVHLRNEAKLAGLAQTPLRPANRRRHGEGEVPSSFIYLSGHVGIGSAILIEGRPVPGQHGWSGEIGHVVVTPDGRACGCGNRGCLEQYAGRSAILTAAGLDPWAPFEELTGRLAAGDPAALAAIADAADALGRALAGFVNIVDVETIVLGGIYAPLYPRIAPRIVEIVNDQVLFAPLVRIEVREASERAYAAMTGGARDVLHEMLAQPAAWIGRDLPPAAPPQ